MKLERNKENKIVLLDLNGKQAVFDYTVDAKEALEKGFTVPGKGKMVYEKNIKPFDSGVVEEPGEGVIKTEEAEAIKKPIFSTQGKLIKKPGRPTKAVENI